MIELRYATAGQVIPLGFFLDSIDQDTEEVGLTLNNTDILLWKWGAVTVTAKNAGGATHIQNGIYYCTLDDTDTDTYGPMKIYIHKAGSMAMVVECAVISQNDWDSKYGDELKRVDANIAIGSSGVNTIAESSVLTTGSQVGTYTNTQQRDGTYNQISDAAGTMEIYYQFDVGTTGVPSAITLFGRLTGLNDVINVYGWNWNLSSWEQVGSITGQATSIDVEITFSLLNTHVGSDANDGKVRVRFYNTGLTTANLYIDQLYVTYAVVQSPVGYANGQIWVDTVLGYAGSVENVNGVADYPVNNWADALILSGLKNIKSFNIANGSTITLSGNSDNYHLDGNGWILNLNGQSIIGAFFHGATVTGAGTNGGILPIFEDCRLGTCTLPAITARGCAFTADITCNEAGTYFFDQCYSGVAGVAMPSILFLAPAGAININMRHYSGGIEIKNMGVIGTDNMSLEGWGQFVINATCVGGTLAVRGHFKKTDNASGAVTISDDANFKSNIIHFGKAQGPGTGNNQMQLATTASAADGAYDPAEVTIVEGTGAGQTRLIYQYDGASKTITVDRNWKVNPDATSEYRIIAHSGREHVNEGLVRAGTINTVQLNTLASAFNNAYNNQIIFLRSGTGEDQVRSITAYDGTTKIATVNTNWDVIPDTTSGYVILPCQTDKTGYSLSATGIDSIWDEIQEGTLTARQLLRIIVSALTGKTTGGGTTLLTSRDVADSKARVTLSVDANNNRTASTLDGT